MRRGRQLERLPGTTGTARLDRRTKRLTGRLRAGDIAIIDHVDIDRVSADALVACQVAAVVNAAPSISGRYPNLGPEILVAGGIPLLVTTPDTPGSLVSAIKPVLVPAGATMTGQLMLRPELADPAPAWRCPRPRLVDLTGAFAEMAVTSVSSARRAA